MPSFIGLLLVLFGGVPLVYIVGRLQAKHGWAGPDWAHWLTVGVFIAAWWPFGLAARDAGASFDIGVVRLTFDGLAVLLAALSLGLGTLAAIYSGPYLADAPHREHYHALLLALIGSMVGLGCSADLFNVWVWFEVLSIASVLLVGFEQHRAAALDAMVKLLIQSAVGSVLILFGIALVILSGGSLDLALLTEATLPSPLRVVAGGLFVVGFGVKAALVPLHTWLPDAHAEAPSGISALLSGVVIEAALLALLRVLAAMFGVSLFWGALLMVLGVANMLLGNLMALGQTQVKRLLAYSSLSQMGYMLLGLGLGLHGTLGGLNGGLFHVLTHGLMKGLAFLSAGALLFVLHHSASNDHDSLQVDDLAGAGRRYPLVALTLSLAVLGLAGLPPLAGFMSKWQVLAAGVSSGELWVLLLVVFAGLNSVLSLGYYAPLVNTLYKREPSAVVAQGVPLSMGLTAPLVVLAGLIVVLGVWPGLAQPLVSLASQAVLPLPVSPVAGW